MAVTKKASFDATLAKLAKKYDTTIGSLADVAREVESISTGNLAIDHILGVGGFPKGRLVELFGPPSCGKTTCALQSAAEFQRRARAGDPGFAGRVVLYMDHENAMDPMYAHALGLDVNDAQTFLFAQPSSLEDSANIARGLVETGKVGLVIFDSVAAMIPSSSLTAETGKASVALQARLMADFLKAFTEEVYVHDTTAIFLNHIAEVIDMGGKPGVKRWTTPGGRALKFAASLRLEFKQIKNITEDVYDDLTNDTMRQVQATDVVVKVVKNKVSAPFKRAVVRVRYGKGFDQGFSAFDVLKGHKKVIEGAGGYFFFDRVPELAVGLDLNAKDRPFIRGLHNVLARCDADPQWRDLMVKIAQQALQDADSGGSPVLEVTEDEGDGDANASSDD